MSSSEIKGAPEGHSIIEEGQAKIVFPSENTVFYNKVQVFNRDLSILIIQTYIDRQLQEQKERHELKLRRYQERLAAANAPPEPEPEGTEEDIGRPKKERPPPIDPGEFKAEGLRVFEALSASGLRSIRYFKEIQGLHSVVANDLSAAAVETIKKNVLFNGLTAEQVIPSQGDANLVMMIATSQGKQYDVVDLDPYGSAIPFLDCAVQAACDGGLLLVTCTDMAVICGGSNAQKCFARYGAMPGQGNACHDMAVRIVLQAIERSATKLGRHIEPLISMSIDFYLRVAVRVHQSNAGANTSACKQSMVYTCSQCGSYAFQSLGMAKSRDNNGKFGPGSGPPVNQTCDECGGHHKMGGPIWSAAMHDSSFVREMLAKLEANKDKFASAVRLKGNLSVVAEELPVPLMLDIPAMCRILKCTLPPGESLRSALIHGGYAVSQTHTDQKGIKTTAPYAFIWDVLRCWIKAHPNVKPVPAGSIAERILAKEPRIVADFTKAPGSVTGSRHTGVPKFIKNPAYWGPGSRARPQQREGTMHEDLAKKSWANQGKRKRKERNTVAEEQPSTTAEEQPADQDI
jgi:tRNA (guanine26-N2/guanine27-N2)-dimethyltransferase